MKDCAFCGEPTRWAEILEDERLLCPACKPCLFFERRLTLTEDFAGRPFVLMPWLREVTRDVFGTVDASGERQYRDVYLEVGKGNSKTTWCAGLVLYCLSTATASGTEVYSAATAKDQAGIVFRYASQMVQVSRPLSALLKVLPSTKRIVRRDDPTSFYAAISADGDIHDGMAPSFVVRDELHRWRTRKALELNEILERGMVKRENPLIVDITTAGEEDESPLCWRRHEYARQIAEGAFEDRRFYGRIWAADRDRIDSDPEFWKTREAGCRRIRPTRIAAGI
jgi:phage terminase large subunit-like protein